MIILITGQSGNGKTAHAVDMLAHDPQFKDRPIFAMGIPELKIEHSPCPTVDNWTMQRPDPDDPSLLLPYFTFPENAVIIIDEAQRVFRPRAIGSRVPDAVQAFETHRHCGIDFILITQSPGLIDSNIRKNIGKHIHIRATAFGRYRYEWAELGDPESSASRDLSAKSRYTLPTRAFNLYKSSERHTKVKTAIPKYFWLMLGAFAVMIALAVYVYGRISTAIDPSKANNDTTIERNIHQMQDGHRPARQQDEKPIKTALEYVEERQPRLAGMLHTAPVYDELTQPDTAPYIAGCYVFRDQCKCKTQQGTSYDTTDTICRHYVKQGQFRDWGNKEDNENPQVGHTPDVPQSVETRPFVSVLDSRGHRPSAEKKPG